MKFSDLPVFGAAPSELTFSSGPEGAVVTGCSRNVTQVSVPASHGGVPVIAIGEGAFREHPYLLSVTLPDSVRRIGESAFMDCHSLMHVLGGAGIAQVGPYAFYQCVNLRTVELPGRPEAARTSFAGCYQLGAANEPVTYR